MKKYLISVILLIALILFGVYISQNKNTETVRIAAIYPLTGGLSSYGEPAQKVAQLAVADVNASGGINGKKLEVVFEDHRCDPKTAVSAFEKLNSSQNIHIFTSVACTGTALAMIPSLQTKDSILLGTVTSGNKLTSVSPYFFRNWASDLQESKLLADQIIKKGYKNIAVIYEETDYAKGLVISLEDFLKGTNVKISKESFTSDSKDIISQLIKLQALHPDLMFVSVQTVSTGELVMTQMEQLRFKPSAMFVNDNILKASALVASHSNLLEGAIGGDYAFIQSGALVQLLKKYKDTYGTDCPQINICAAEYDAVQFLAKALSASDGSTQSVQKYLKQNSYNGVSGTIGFDENNDRKNAQYSLFVIKSGKAELF